MTATSTLITLSIVPMFFFIFIFLFLVKIINSIVILLFQYLFWTAFIWQYFAHLPHSMHVASSITGKPYPAYEIAPTEQTGIIGHCGFADMLMDL